MVNESVWSYYTNGYLGIKLDLQKDVLHVAKLAKEIPNVHFKITLLSLPDDSSKKCLKKWKQLVDYVLIHGVLLFAEATINVKVQ